MGVLVNLNKRTGAVECKVADLGLAKFKREGDAEALGPLGPCKTRRNPNMTRGCGTPMYGAPEQFGSTNYGSKADMYAMGIILFEIFVSLPRKTRYKVIGELRRRRQKVLDKYMSRYPVAAGLVSALLRTNPDDRPSCLDIMKDPDIPLGDPSNMSPAMRAFMQRELTRRTRSKSRRRR